MSSSPTPPNLDRAFNQLKRGLMTGSHKVSLTAYSTIYNAGADAIPKIVAELEKFDLKKPLRLEATHLLSGLLALHRDIDENGSDQFLARQNKLACPPVTAALLRSAGRISNRDYRKIKSGDIDIWEQENLDEQYRASEFVRTWLAEVPDADLAGIRKIYILPEMVEKEWAGKYLPGLAVITLAWWNVLPADSRFNWAVNKNHRFVLFHEIGHHVHRHWFGQDPEQEEEADAYALELTRKHSSRLSRIVRCGISLARKLLGVTQRHQAIRAL